MAALILPRPDTDDNVWGKCAECGHVFQVKFGHECSTERSKLEDELAKKRELRAAMSLKEMNVGLVNSHALINYFEKRDEGNVGVFGIATPKHQFMAGGWFEQVDSTGTELDQIDVIRITELLDSLDAIIDNLKATNRMSDDNWKRCAASIATIERMAVLGLINKSVQISSDPA